MIKVRNLFNVLWSSIKKFGGDTIPKYSSQIECVMTIVMAVLTYIMVKLTCSTDKLSNRILEERHTATFYIDDTLYVSKDDSYWIINLRNIGPSNAFDINIEFPEYNVSEYLCRRLRIDDTKRFEASKWFRCKKEVVDSIIKEQKKSINIKVIYSTKFGKEEIDHHRIISPTPYIYKVQR